MLLRNEMMMMTIQANQDSKLAQHIFDNKITENIDIPGGGSGGGGGWGTPILEDGEELPLY